MRQSTTKDTCRGGASPYPRPGGANPEIPDAVPLRRFVSSGINCLLNYPCVKRLEIADLRLNSLDAIYKSAGREGDSALRKPTLLATFHCSWLCHFCLDRLAFAWLLNNTLDTDCLTPLRNRRNSRLRDISSVFLVRSIWETMRLLLSLHGAQFPI